MSTKPEALNALALAKRLRRLSNEHKGHAGKALLIGGAPGMAGALLLAGKTCLHLGAGWTILEILDPATAHAANDSPELMIKLADSSPQAALTNHRPDLIAIGPGLGSSLQALQWVTAVLNYPDIPVVIDADAINLIAQTPDLLNALQARNVMFPGQTVLTPHPGEAARLLNCTTESIQADRNNALEKLVSLTQSILVLKGHHTLLASPGHTALECQEGNPGMGTGGMGDILTGCIAALGVQGVRHELNLWKATGLAVQLHAAAADSLVAKGVGPLGLTPSETILEMRYLLNQLTKS
jgi:ADP-dependent NAD(P)H-hydrate dehydratase / NAD(P)H-hydrate epimerase